MESEITDRGMLVPKSAVAGTGPVSNFAYCRQLVRSTIISIASSQAAVRLTGIMVARARQRSITGEPMRAPG